MASKKKKSGGGSSFMLLFVLLLLVVGAGVGYVHIQKDTFEVERKIIVKSDADDVWPLIADFKQWPEWGPWKEDDSTIKWEHGESGNEVGDVLKWTGKDGPGQMTWTKLVEDKSATYSLKFDDYDPMSGSIRLVENEEDETTTVVWKSSGSKGGLIGKGIFLVLGMEAKMAKMFDRGLENIKTKVEAK